MDKGRNAVQNLEQGGDPERRHNHHESKGKSSEKSQHGDKDKARKREGSPNLERGKSESFPNGEKEKGPPPPSSKFTPRTFSR